LLCSVDFGASVTGLKQQLFFYSSKKKKSWLCAFFWIYFLKLLFVKDSVRDPTIIILFCLCWTALLQRGPPLLLIFSFFFKKSSKLPHD